MKSNLYTFGLSALGLVLAVLISLPLSSCKKKNEPLSLFGEWQEKQYDIYYDSVRSHTQHRLILDCPQDLAGDTAKTGDFLMYIKSFHAPSYNDSSRYVFMEYVKGTYSVNEEAKMILFRGDYYTDSLFREIATDSTFPYSYGPYEMRSGYKLDDISLTLNLEDSTRSDFNTFYPVRQYNCL